MDVRRLISLALVLTVVAGCRTWRAVPQSSEPTRRIGVSRVMLADGERIWLQHGRLTPDTLFGVAYTGLIAIPRDSVARVEEHRVSWIRSAGLFLVVYFGMAFVISGAEALPVP